MPPVPVTIDRNNQAPDVEIGSEDTINWNVEGDADDFVLFYFESKKSDRGPFNTPGGSGPRRGLYSCFFPNSNPRNVPSGLVTVKPGKDIVETWKYTIIRIKGSAPQLTITDPQVSIRGS